MPTYFFLLLFLLLPNFVSAAETQFLGGVGDIVYDIAVDSKGYLHLSVPGRILRREADGSYTKIAGTDDNRYYMRSLIDNVSAKDADLFPKAIAFGPRDELFFVSIYRPFTGNVNESALIYKIDSSGVLHRIAGNGRATNTTGTIEGANALRINLPASYYSTPLAVDTEGNLFFYGSPWIYKIDSSKTLRRFPPQIQQPKPLINISSHSSMEMTIGSDGILYVGSYDRAFAIEPNGELSTIKVDFPRDVQSNFLYFALLPGGMVWSGRSLSSLQTIIYIQDLNKPSKLLAVLPRLEPRLDHFRLYKFAYDRINDFLYAISESIQESPFSGLSISQSVLWRIKGINQSDETSVENWPGH